MSSCISRKIQNHTPEIMAISHPGLHFHREKLYDIERTVKSTEKSST